jgi:hypothetical protein
MFDVLAPRFRFLSFSHAQRQQTGTELDIGTSYTRPLYAHMIHLAFCNK